MLRTWHVFLLMTSVALVAGEDQPWKAKQAADWNDDDVKQVLNDSPWSKTVKPDIKPGASQRRSGGGMGRGGGIGLGGIGIGLPGTGGGMGRHGGGYPGGGQGGGTTDGTSTDTSEPPTLHLRWESALPIREAELKARETNAPSVDEDHYAIAVYGVPSRMANGSADDLARQFKSQASIKREGKKDLKPSSVDVLQREDGPVIVYLFPRSKEIARQDRRVEFDAQIGRLQFAQSFYVDDMMYQGKLEL